MYLKPSISTEIHCVLHILAMHQNEEWFHGLLVHFLFRAAFVSNMRATVAGGEQVVLKTTWEFCVSNPNPNMLPSGMGLSRQCSQSTTKRPFSQQTFELGSMESTAILKRTCLAAYVGSVQGLELQLHGLQLSQIDFHKMSYKIIFLHQIWLLCCKKSIWWQYPSKQTAFLGTPCKISVALQQNSEELLRLTQDDVLPLLGHRFIRQFSFKPSKSVIKIFSACLIPTRLCFDITQPSGQNIRKVKLQPLWAKLVQLFPPF